MQAGDAEHGVVNAVAFQSAVAKDLPTLHPGEDVLHAGTDFAVGSVCVPPGAPVAAVHADRGLVDGVFRAGQLPRLAVFAVAGDWSADRDDEPGVGVDDDLVRLVEYR